MQIEDCVLNNLNRLKPARLPSSTSWFLNMQTKDKAKFNVERCWNPVVVDHHPV